MHQVVQVGGALLILAAFVVAQFGWLDGQSYPYLILNLVGATVLAFDAWREEQAGFLILEFVWAVVSAWGLLQRLRGRPAATPGH